MMSWLLLAVQVATMQYGGEPQRAVAAVVMADADVVWCEGAPRCLGQRLEKFGYDSYRDVYSRRRIVDACGCEQGAVIYFRCCNRVMGVVCGSVDACACSVKGSKVEGLVTCDDEMRASGRIESYLYPETSQGIIDRAARCEWCHERTERLLGPSH